MVKMSVSFVKHRTLFVIFYVFNQRDSNLYIFIFSEVCLMSFVLY